MLSCLLAEAAERFRHECAELNDANAPIEWWLLETRFRTLITAFDPASLDAAAAHALADRLIDAERQLTDDLPPPDYLDEGQERHLRVDAYETILRAHSQGM